MRAASIILAGGRSRRFGRDKIFEVLGNETLLEQVIRRVSPISQRVILSVAPGQSIPLAEQLRKRTIEIVDIYPGKGSLGGIYSGLMESDSLYNLVVACDMPFLNISLLQYMLQLAPEYDVIIPKIGERAEPLHAIYSRNCIGPIRELLDHDVLRVIAFFDKVRVRWVEEDEVNRFDPHHLSFLNINTPSDLEQAKFLSDSVASKGYSILQK